MEKLTVKHIVEEHFVEESTASMCYVLADIRAENFIEKMTHPMLNKHFIICLDEDKIHILELGSANDRVEIDEQTTYLIGSLRNIRIEDIGSFENPTAKAISFKDANNRTHKYRIFLKAGRYTHPQQRKHLTCLIGALMPLNR